MRKVHVIKLSCLGDSALDDKNSASISGQFPTAFTLIHLNDLNGKWKVHV